MNIFYKIKTYFISKKYLILGLVLFLILIIIVYFNNNNNEEVVINNTKEVTEVEKEEIKEKCIVDIKGYVNNIGLYEVDCNSRVNDVIIMAGGLKDNANTSVINLGKKVFDQMVLVIYSNDEVNNFLETKKKEEIIDNKCIEKSVVGNDACIKKEDRIETKVIVSDNNLNVDNNISNKLISINNATKEELMTLTGVGESKAQAIINYREENGPFKSIEDIKNVTGIGEKMFDKIKDSITL